MKQLAGTGDVRIESFLSETDERSLANDVLDGLTRPFKEIPAKHFYDARGSELFERICELPEYYPTRTEREILLARADGIVRRTRAGELVELGSGSAEKARILLSAMARAGTLRRYVPLDVSESALEAAAEELMDEFDELTVHGVIGDFERHLAHVPGPDGGWATNCRAARRHDRKLPARHAPAPAARDRQAARPGRPAAARHRPGEGPGGDRSRLRRLRRRHRRVQSQRPSRDQPRARRRLLARGV